MAIEKPQWAFSLRYLRPLLVGPPRLFKVAPASLCTVCSEQSASRRSLRLTLRGSLCVQSQEGSPTLSVVSRDGLHQCADGWVIIIEGLIYLSVEEEKQAVSFERLKGSEGNLFFIVFVDILSTSRKQSINQMLIQKKGHKSGVHALYDCNKTVQSYHSVRKK